MIAFLTLNIITIPCLDRHCIIISLLSPLLFIPHHLPSPSPSFLPLPSSSLFIPLRPPPSPPSLRRSPSNDALRRSSPSILENTYGLPLTGSAQGPGLAPGLTPGPTGRPLSYRPTSSRDSLPRRPLSGRWNLGDTSIRSNGTTPSQRDNGGMLSMLATTMLPPTPPPDSASTDFAYFAYCGEITPTEEAEWVSKREFSWRQPRVCEGLSVRSIARYITHYKSHVAHTL